MNYVTIQGTPSGRHLSGDIVMNKTKDSDTVAKWETAPQHYPLLVEELLKQQILREFKGAANKIAEICTVLEYPAGSTIYSAGDTSRYISLILSGRISIVINNKEVAQRAAGQHFGEMALIDPAPRSATIVAVEDTMIANVSEPDFTELADHLPKLWRYLALELAEIIRLQNSR